MTAPPDTPPPKVRHPLIRTAPEGPVCACQREREDEVRWLAILIRQGLKLVVVGIEKRYGIEDKGGRAA